MAVKIGAHPADMKPRALLEQEMISLLGLRLKSYFPEMVYDHPAIWLGEVFRNVGTAVGSGDTTAIAIACELIERDPMLPFGKLIKSGLARSLRKSHSLLVDSEKVQIVSTVKRLLNQEFAPRELEDYCKLVKKLSVSEYMDDLSQVVPKNPKSMRLLAYLANS